MGSDDRMILPPPPPPGLNYIAFIKPQMNILIIHAIGAAILLPLLVSLFFFSTKRLRRKPVFIFNVISILLGLAVGMFYVAETYTTITDPLKPFKPSRFKAIVCLPALAPILTESILLLRVFTVYPYRTTPRWAFILIVILVMSLKLARIVNITADFVLMNRAIKGLTSSALAGQAAWGDVGPTPKIEWALQVAENGVASALFLYKLNLHNAFRSEDHTTQSTRRRGSYASIVKGLFWISVSNFIFPVVLSLVQLIYTYRDILRGTYVLSVNIYVEIIGVLLATVWAAGSNWSREQNERSAVSTDFSSLPTIQFASGTNVVSTNLISLSLDPSTSTGRNTDSLCPSVSPSEECKSRTRETRV
ncbi:hypothetical protein AMATHDRAFT_69230 [Amanita thiersii Skay4041]|uniref:G-protein coupled receptors family 1 profile domain-containing protein n=1 Tax=Amanita thiersii Skay4041 TaxID=703135 RepID=A0A2A9N9M6_9AGAR|nr:hypothetical protein AMATHDRAFT_69230 [Amanita thiersii Skay4041]